MRTSPWMLAAAALLTATALAGCGTRLPCWDPVDPAPPSRELVWTQEELGLLAMANGTTRGTGQTYDQARPGTALDKVSYQASQSTGTFQASDGPRTVDFGTYVTFYARNGPYQGNLIVSLNGPDGASFQERATEAGLEPLLRDLLGTVVPDDEVDSYLRQARNGLMTQRNADDGQDGNGVWNAMVWVQVPVPADLAELVALAEGDGWEQAWTELTLSGPMAGDGQYVIYGSGRVVASTHSDDQDKAPSRATLEAAIQEAFQRDGLPAPDLDGARSHTSC